MIFLPFVPASLAAALVWSDDLSRGAWYASALSLNWIFGTLSYYAPPSLGPIYVEPYRFFDLPTTAVTGLQDALWGNRVEVLADPHATQSVHGIAAFASLHTSIVFTAALVATLCACRRSSAGACGSSSSSRPWRPCTSAGTTCSTSWPAWRIGGGSVWLAALMTGRTGPLSRPAPGRRRPERGRRRLTAAHLADRRPGPVGRVRRTGAASAAGRREDLALDDVEDVGHRARDGRARRSAT